MDRRRFARLRPLPAGAALLLLTLACTPGPTSAQDPDAREPHPRKRVYADAPSWPATAPGSVTLQGFGPFRAVYDREYTQASGPGQGEKRQDRVIVHAEEVGWDGTRAVALTMIDSGDAQYSDTNMRGLFQIAALDDLTVRFEIGPVPGAAKDYYLARATDRELLLSQVDTAEQTVRAQQLPTAARGFGPGSWVMASMDLEEGQKIRLDPYYSPQANPISQSSYGRVIGRTQLTDGSGTEHDAWVVETPGWYGPASSKVLRLHLKDSPPYYLGTEIYDYDTDEARRFVWLRHAATTRP